MALSSSSDSYDKFVLSSSSDDGAELLLLAVSMVVKAIVEDANEGTSQPQPKRRKYIVRERETANDLLASDYFSPEPTYLRKPAFSDMQQILEHHAKYHGLPGMIGSLDCIKWEWELCLTAWQDSHTSGYHGMPVMMLEAVAP
ncbi:uncharacterized protein LOC110876758 [Helianthus annuus]|uniref:uncharacterized protein LOC110876758 n=1 Tax=Helianthus annuus TaxID=4232 RepID=UPI000B9070BC|nr:uncharacterized protein LOC110876758 [Helianthus annuus]